jgi:hypothetical protein
MQVGISMALTVVFLFLGRAGSIQHVHNDADSGAILVKSVWEWNSNFRLLVWSELAIATGISLTQSGSFEKTANNIKAALRKLNPMRPDRPQTAIASLLGIAFALAWWFTFQQPISWVDESGPVSL